jgi:hypothetical protein
MCLNLVPKFQVKVDGPTEINAGTQLKNNTLEYLTSSVRITLSELCFLVYNREGAFPFQCKIKINKQMKICTLSDGLEGLEIWLRFPAGKDVLFSNVQAGSGARPASYPKGTKASFSGGKAAGT